MSDNKTTRKQHSIHPNDFPISKAFDQSNQSREFVIEKVRRMPPEKFSLADSLLIAVGLMVVINFGMANIIMYISGGTLNNAIISLSNIWVLGYSVVLVGIFTFVLLRDSVEIEFESDRGADHFLEFIIQRFGLKPPQSKNGQLIFKPSLYNMVMLFAQKIRITITGSFVTISGSYIFLRRVKKMLHSFQK